MLEICVISGSKQLPNHPGQSFPANLLLSQLKVIAFYHYVCHVIAVDYKLRQLTCYLVFAQTVIDKHRGDSL